MDIANVVFEFSDSIRLSDFVFILNCVEHERNIAYNVVKRNDEAANRLRLPFKGRSYHTNGEAQKNNGYFFQKDGFRDKAITFLDADAYERTKRENGDRICRWSFS